MGNRLQRVVARAMQSLGGARGAGLVSVCVVTLGDLDNVAGVAQLRIVAVWSVGIVVDDSGIEVVDDRGIKVECIDIDID